VGFGVIYQICFLDSNIIQSRQTLDSIAVNKLNKSKGKE